MLEHVPPAPREMSADARNVLLCHDLRHLTLLRVLSAMAFLAGAALLLAAMSDLWVGLATATTEGTSREVVQRGDRVSISYEFSVDGKWYVGEIDSKDSGRFANTGPGQDVVVEYCSLWPRQSRLVGTSSSRPFELSLAGILLVILAPLAVILRRKRRRIALRERAYRDGTPAAGRAIELAWRNLQRTRWAELRYSFRVPDGVEEIEGAVTASSREDLEHLDRDDITVLFLPDDPQQSIVYWDE